jgi:DNA-binding transcriptional ArsR family regulator
MPITEISHLFDLLSLKKQVSGDGEEKSVAKLDTREKILYELLKEPLSKSELLERSKLTPSEFLIALTNLEMEGFITASLHEVRKVV